MNQKNKKINNDTQRYESINGLRAYAAIGVVMMHVYANLGYCTSISKVNSIIGSLGFFVFMFMIVSGFSMCCGYYEKITIGSISIFEFYEKRYKKIWPYFALLVFLDILVSPSVFSFYEAFANLTLCFGLLPNARITVIGVGWTLGVIFLFYMLFPFFCFLLKTKKRAWFSFAVALIFNYICTQYFFDANHVLEGFEGRTNFIFCAMFFIAGGIVYLYRQEIALVIGKIRWIFLLVCLMITIIFFERSVMPFFLIESVITIWELILFVFWLMYAIAIDDIVLNNKFTEFMSGISMEVYLCHMVIFRGLEKIGVVRVLKESTISYLVVFVLTLLGAIAFSMIFKSIIKKLIIKISDKRN